MDISNTTVTGTTTPLAGNVAKVPAPAEVRKPAVQGNSLPHEVQGRVPAENSPAEATVSKPAPEELQKLVDQANTIVQKSSSDLKFLINEDSNSNVVIRIENSETGELIRQFPSEEMLAVARTLDKIKQGSMFDGKA